MLVTPVQPMTSLVQTANPAVNSGLRAKVGAAIAPHQEVARGIVNRATDKIRFGLLHKEPVAAPWTRGVLFDRNLQKGFAAIGEVRAAGSVSLQSSRKPDIYSDNPRARYIELNPEEMQAVETLVDGILKSIKGDPAKAAELVNTVNLHIQTEMIKQVQKGNKINVATDIFKDPDDIGAMVVISFLVRMGLLELKTVVTTHGSSEVREIRANLTAGLLEELGHHVGQLGDVIRVGVGVDYELEKGQNRQDHDHVILPAPGNIVEQAPKGAISFDSIAMIKASLEAGADKSEVLLLIAGHTDHAKLLEDNEELIKQKVKEIHIMGGYDIVDGEIVPTEQAANNKFDMAAAKKLYKLAQKLGIPIYILTKSAAAATAVGGARFPEIAKTQHPVAILYSEIQERSLMEALFVPIMTGVRKGLSLEWFFYTFIGDEASFDKYNTDPSNVDLVKSERKARSERMATLLESFNRTKGDPNTPHRQAAVTEYVDGLKEIFKGDFPFSDEVVNFLNTDDYKPLWKTVKRLLQYDTLTVLMSVPLLREILFRPEEILPDSQVYRVDAEQIKDKEMLRNLLTAFYKLSLRGKPLLHPEDGLFGASLQPDSSAIAEAVADVAVAGVTAFLMFGGALSRFAQDAWYAPARLFSFVAARRPRHAIAAVGDSSGAGPQSGSGGSESPPSDDESAN